MHYVLTLFAGAFLCNCIPHLSSGLRGAPFPTPFARPRGVGDSPPFLNFLWGSFNLFIGIYVRRLHCSTSRPRRPVSSRSLIRCPTRLTAVADCSGRSS